MKTISHTTAFFQKVLGDKSVSFNRLDNQDQAKFNHFKDLFQSLQQDNKAIENARYDRRKPDVGVSASESFDHKTNQRKSDDVAWRQDQWHQDQARQDKLVSREKPDLQKVDNEKKLALRNEEAQSPTSPAKTNTEREDYTKADISKVNTENAAPKISDDQIAADDTLPGTEDVALGVEKLVLEDDAIAITELANGTGLANDIVGSQLASIAMTERQNTEHPLHGAMNTEELALHTMQEKLLTALQDLIARMQSGESLDKQQTDFLTTLGLKQSDVSLMDLQNLIAGLKNGDTTLAQTMQQLVKGSDLLQQGSAQAWPHLMGKIAQDKGLSPEGMTSSLAQLKTGQQAQSQPFMQPTAPDASLTGGSDTELLADDTAEFLMKPGQANTAGTKEQNPLLSMLQKAQPSATLASTTLASTPLASAALSDQAKLAKTMTLEPIQALTGNMEAASLKNASMARETVMAQQSAQVGRQIPMDKVGIEISRQVMAGNTRFQIRLDPPELGRIDVKLEMNADGNMLARMVVEKSETLDMFLRDARQLERALQQAGLDSDKTQLEFKLKQDGQDQRSAQNQAHQDNEDFSHDQGSDEADMTDAQSQNYLMQLDDDLLAGMAQNVYQLQSGQILGVDFNV